MSKPLKRSASNAAAQEEPIKKQKVFKGKERPEKDSTDKTRPYEKSTKKAPFKKPGGFTKPGGFKKPGGFSKPGGFKNAKGDTTAGGGGKGNYVNKFKGKPTDNKDEPNEKTDWRKFKEDKKSLKLKRKQSKDSYEISIEAKQIYEKLKCRRTEKKSELVEKLYDLLSAGDTIKKIVMAHDTARIIQCMLKFATTSLRDQLSERLLPLAVEMAVSKYSHFCVLRMFKYGSPTIKSKLVDSFFGNIVRLACHNISSKILDHVYLSVANAKQKCYMRQEFYGDLYKRSKDESVKQLSDTYKDTTNMKASILGSVKSNLEHVANKKLVDSSLVHAVMLEYIRECDDEKLEEAVTMMATLIPLMLTTKDGCQTSIICFYKSSPKNRRAIIKTIKEHLVKICNHEHGHIFVLTVLNALDDTKATKKALYDTIHPELQTLMSSQWGRRVIEWLTAPGDTKSFHPAFIATIEEGLQYGKKDKDLRRKEIFEQIEEPIALAIAELPPFWLSNKHIGLVTAGILKNLNDVNFVTAATALCMVIAEPKWSVEVEDETKEKKSKKSHDVEKIIADATEQNKMKQQKAKKEAAPKVAPKVPDNVDVADDASESDDDEIVKKSAKDVEIATTTVSGIEEAGLHIILKKIIKSDKERIAVNAEAQTFGSILVEQLTADTLTYWLTVNRACFVLLNVAENNNEQVVAALKDAIKPHKALLKKQSVSGAQLLAKKLSI